MTIETFIIISFAVWRFSHGIVKENGPLMAFAKLRAYLASTQKRSGGLFDMLSCVSCTSFWIGLGASLFVSHGIISFIGYGFAFSGLSVLFEGLFNKLNALTFVASPAAHNQVDIRRGAAPEQGNNMIGNPDTAYGSLAVKATTTLND